MTNLLYSPWPWYVGGPALGLAVLAMIYITGKQFGISLALKAGCVAASESVLRFSPFKNYQWRDDAWRLFFATGLMAGGFIALYLLNDNQSVAIAPATVEHLRSLGIQDFSSILPSELFGNNALSNPAILVYLFSGGVLIGFGSRYANGCTSGHGIMGLSYFQLASLVAVTGFFIGGVVATHWIFPAIARMILNGGGL